MVEVLFVLHLIMKKKKKKATVKVAAGKAAEYDVNNSEASTAVLSKHRVEYCVLGHIVIFANQNLTKKSKRHMPNFAC